MRVTQSMLASDSLRNLSNSYERLAELQNQLSTGKKITRPSQDPVVAMKGMYYRSNLREVEQYQRNLSEAFLWMDNSEAGLEQANSALQRVRELIVQGKNGTYSEEDRFAIATEIEQLKKDLMETANTKVTGRYIFNGTKIDTPPVNPEKNPMVELNTDNYMVEVSPGVQIQTNINSEKIFDQGLFDTLDEIIKTFDEDFDSAQMDQLLSKIDSRLDTLQAERSELGARYNRLEMIETRLGKTEVMANKIISDNEDAEMEKVITELTVQESIHRAALSVGARIIQPTLMDFLR